MTSAPEARPKFARLVGGLLWAFAIGFLLGAVQVGRALWSGRVWANYRGEVVSQTAMRRELIFFIVAALLCSLLAWFWHRLRRDRP